MCKKNDKPMTAKEKAVAERKKQERAARRQQWQKNYETTLKVKQSIGMLTGIASILGTLATLGIVFFVIFSIINALRGG